MRSLAIAAFACAVASSGCISRAIGEAMAAPFKGLVGISNERLKVQRKIDQGEKPSLAIEPGEKGHLSHPAAPGPQYHYWITGGADRTFIVADVFYGDVKQREIIASYHGYYAEYDSSKVKMDPPWGRLFVDVVDGSGRPLQHATLRIKQDDGTTDLNLGDGTECEWYLEAGEYTIQVVVPARSSFGRLHRITIANYESHEYVVSARSIRNR
ncbi:MAG: hypothetical protein OER88_11590 [Planctomycetota bacterium]|nr:hypothetical protein [Planctomycetota bacterium]